MKIASNSKGIITPQVLRADVRSKRESYCCVYAPPKFYLFPLNAPANVTLHLGEKEERRHLPGNNFREGIKVLELNPGRRFFGGCTLSEVGF